MRTIKFRGKRVSDKKWVFGYYAKVNNNHFIIEPHDNIHGFIWHEVIPETVGQFTGLTDKNGKEIYEGDILFAENRIINEKSYVFYNSGAFYAFGDILEKAIVFNDITVIGNIHDNPELLQ